MNDQNSNQDYHISVLYHEALDALDIQPDGVYVDCTFGGGGHSRGILSKLGPSGKLIAFDQDDDAQNNLPQDDRLIFVPHNFRHIQRFLRLYKHEKVNGILADLGVSSHQFDTGERGFSTRFDGPLDMRMDRRQELTAADVLKSYSEQKLHKLFEQYGEVTNAKTLAKHIVQNRQKVVLNSIDSFRTLLQPVIKGNPHKYLAQVFQALRIEVNSEMSSLKEMLQQSGEVLQSGGRLVVITFHSLEDRIVKTYMKNMNDEAENDNPFDNTRKEQTFRMISKKPILAADDELKRNPRARSAKMRVAERV